MKSDSVQLTEGQVEFLMSKFKIQDPNEAIDFLIEMMVLENVDPMDMKRYILKMMQKDLIGLGNK